MNTKGSRNWKKKSTNTTDRIDGEGGNLNGKS